MHSHIMSDIDFDFLVLILVVMEDALALVMEKGIIDSILKS